MREDGEGSLVKSHLPYLDLLVPGKGGTKPAQPGQGQVEAAGWC